MRELGYPTSFPGYVILIDDDDELQIANFKLQMSNSSPMIDSEEEKEMDFTNKDSVRQFIKENDITDIVSLNSMLKQISGVFIEEFLEAERDEHLGYGRYEQTDEPKSNSRNGYSPKRVRSVHGEVDLDIPRDRAGIFEPLFLIKKFGSVGSGSNALVSSRGWFSLSVFVIKSDSLLF